MPIIIKKAMTNNIMCVVQELHNFLRLFKFTL